MANSIRHKFSPLVPDFLLDDEDVLGQLLDHVYICNYQLQSSTFCLEQHYLTGYYGTCELHFTGPDPLRRIAEALFCFGNWSGIGVKTTLGMGGCTVRRIEQKKKGDR